jgi:Zn-dependent protease
MRKPGALLSGDEAQRVGTVFGTPLVVKGYTWLPLVQLLTWLVMIWQAGRRRPGRSWLERAGVAALTMLTLLGSEWGHNLAHAAAAKAIGKPMDAMRVFLGMPLCVYYDINDVTVTPRQHIARSLGGPLFNVSLLLAALVGGKFTGPNSVAREVADVAVGMNAFSASVAMLPIPGIDGGSILKWALVKRGLTPQQADERVCKVDGILGVLLTLGSAAALRFGHYFAGAFLAFMGLVSFGVAKGAIKEQ